MDRDVENVDRATNIYFTLNDFLSLERFLRIHRKLKRATSKYDADADTEDKVSSNDLTFMRIWRPYLFNTTLVTYMRAFDIEVMSTSSLEAK